MIKLLAFLPLLLCGCMSMHRVVRELAKDPATVHLQIMVPMYGSMVLDRSFPTNAIPQTK